MLDDTSEQSVQEECPASRTWPTQSASSAKLKSVVRKPTTIVQALIGNPIVQLSAHADRSTTLNPDTNMTSVI